MLNIPFSQYPRPCQIYMLCYVLISIFQTFIRIDDISYGHFLEINWKCLYCNYYKHCSGENNCWLRSFGDLITIKSRFIEIKIHQNPKPFFLKKSVSSVGHRVYIVNDVNRGHRPDDNMLLLLISYFKCQSLYIFVPIEITNK